MNSRTRGPRSTDSATVPGVRVWVTEAASEAASNYSHLMRRGGHRPPQPRSESVGNASCSPYIHSGRIGRAQASRAGDWEFGSQSS